MNSQTAARVLRKCISLRCVRRDMVDSIVLGVIPQKRRETHARHLEAVRENSKQNVGSEGQRQVSMLG